jgi:glycine cleavage system aminomethyltransferase T
MWTVHKRQPNDTRVKFIGEDALKKIVDENKSGSRKDRKRVGFALDSSGIIRENCKIFN